MAYSCDAFTRDKREKREKRNIQERCCVWCLCDVVYDVVCEVLGDALCDGVWHTQTFVVVESLLQLKNIS